MIALRQPPAALAAAAAPDRREELDWLRAFVVLCVILYHVLGIFAAGASLYLRDGSVGLQLDAPSAFVNAWAMPLLFAVSGASALFSLQRRGVGTYLGSRVQRLVVPFVFGTLALVPLQVYGVLLSDPGLLRRNLVPISDPHLLESYPRFYVQYLLGYWYFLGHYSPDLELIFWGHLWFIARLIVCSLAALPVLLLLRTRPGKWLIGSLARGLAWPPAVLLPGVVLGASVMVLREGWARPPLGSWASLDWAQAGLLLLCYLIGYVLYADHRAVRALQRAGPLVLGLALLSFVLLLLLEGGLLPGPLGVALRRMMEGLTTWLWVAVFLSLGSRFLARSSRLLPYVNEGTYSFYVLHMPVLVGMAGLVLPLQVPTAAKIALLLAGTLGATLALYTLIVRRFALTRFLLGVRLARVERVERSPRAAAPVPTSGLAEK